MRNCFECKNAIFDYFEYYSNKRESFVCECSKGNDVDLDKDDCDDFELIKEDER